MADELIDAAAKAICDAAAIWDSPTLWREAEGGGKVAARIVTRYRAEARAAIEVLHTHGFAKADGDLSRD